MVRYFTCFLSVSHFSSVNDVFIEPENNEDGEDDPEDAEGRSSRLWVDRFSPRHYTELLSDDVRQSYGSVHLSATISK